MLRIVRDVIRRMVAQRGFEVRRMPRALLKRSEARLEMSYEFLAPWLRERQRDVFLVQVGANDGVMGDPVHKAIVTYGWRGILVEPQKALFDRLKRNYAGVPGLAFENAAIAEQDGERDLFRVEGDVSLPDFAVGVAAFSRDQVLKSSRWIKDLEDRIVVERVECLTLDSLLNRHGADRIDVLQVDVEGYDAKVVGMVDLRRIRPWIIRYEWIHLPNAEHEACVARLVQGGYRVMRTGEDMVAVRMAD